MSDFLRCRWYQFCCPCYFDLLPWGDMVRSSGEPQLLLSSLASESCAVLVSLCVADFNLGKSSRSGR